MKILVDCRCILVVGTIWLTGCTHPMSQFQPYSSESTTQGNHLTEKEARHLANLEAERRGQDLVSYKEQSVTHEDGKWIFFFMDTSQHAALGSHFGIMVDENTHSTFYSPGR